MGQVPSAPVYWRRFYHLRCDGDPPASWQHVESQPSDGSTELIVFEFFWATLPDGVPPLIAGHGVMLPALLAGLREQSAP